MDWADKKADELIDQWDKLGLVIPSKSACDELRPLLAAALREAATRGEDG